MVFERLHLVETTYTSQQPKIIRFWGRCLVVTQSLRFNQHFESLEGSMLLLLFWHGTLLNQARTLEIIRFTSCVESLASEHPTTVVFRQSSQFSQHGQYLESMDLKIIYSRTWEKFRALVAKTGH